MRLARLVAVAGLAFALSPLFACAADSEDDHAVTPTDENGDDELRSFSVTDADNGKTVTVTEGQNLYVKLRSNPTTGYGWKVTSTDKTFGYPSAEKFFPNGGAVGSGGLDRFMWATKGPLSQVGEHKVTLEYRRSWETNVAAAQTFTFTVKVLAGSCPAAPHPTPGFCSQGHLVPRHNAQGCTTGYDCEPGCGTCAKGSSCQMCWAHMACIPNGALC